MNLAEKVVFQNQNIPDVVAMMTKDKKITYHELYLKIARLKEYLKKEKGIQKGQKILLLVPMSEELYVSLFALWSIGAIPCFMDAGFIKNGMKKNEFRDISGIMGITTYLLYSNINSNLRKLKQRINVKVVQRLEGEKTLEVCELENNYPAILTYTSGTTGIPKIAERTHEFLNIQGEILSQNMDYELGDIELSTMPIFTLSNINCGITTVIADGKYTNLGNSNPEKIVNQIKTTKVNRIMAAPGILGVIADYCISNQIMLGEIRKIMTGGGAVFVDLIQKLKRVFPNARIVTAYGSTEAEPISKLDVTNLSQEYLDKIKNGYGIPAGKIIGVDDCKTILLNEEVIGDITQEEFQRFQTNEVGEIVVTGRNVLKGYVGGIGDKENKFSVDNVKYHRTGDMGVIDEKGELWLRGRKKEPFFHIEAALHANFEIGRTAIFKDDNELILVLEKSHLIELDDILKSIPFTKIDRIIYINKIPTDKRHSSKVDYIELKKILKKG